MTKHQTTQRTSGFIQLPLMGNVAIYARVATRQKVTEGEPPAQVNELQQYALSLGYFTEQVKVFIDEGTAAAAPLLERRGYTSLLAAIRQRSVQVLFIRAEDRLFTDATEPQINAFISLCIDNNVVIVSPNMVYDFQDLSHIALFRFQCVTAYQVIEDSLKVKAG